MWYSIHQGISEVPTSTCYLHKNVNYIVFGLDAYQHLIDLNYNLLMAKRNYTILPGPFTSSVKHHIKIQIITILQRNKVESSIAIWSQSQAPI